LAEFRWILLGLGLLLLAGIWWWGARRTGQAAGTAELREPMSDHAPVERAAAAQYAATGDAASGAPETREWGVPPFEPLSIKTADFEQVPGLDRPMMPGGESQGTSEFEEVRFEEMDADADTVSVPVFSATAQPAAATVEPAAAVAQESTAEFDPPAQAEESLRPTESPTAAAQAAPEAKDPSASTQQRIVTVRVCAAGESPWSGEQLMAALELHGLAYGRYQVYHRNHVDGRSLFCVASLVEPGTFDIAAMPEQTFPGVTLFAVLPGPADALQTVDELFATARDLAAGLSGVVQDAKGVAFSQQRLATLREDVTRFQAGLS
jgi:cell division protein ZipA